MKQSLRIIDIIRDDGQIGEPDWLMRAEVVHRQLRPQLPPDYAAAMQRVFAGGAHMAVATQDDAVLGLAVWRCFENTFNGVHFYVDDLVTDETRRSQGTGRALLAHLEAIARARGARVINLESGTQRTDAHRFYFREGFVVPSFSFRKTL